jgi:dipeptidyl aminopeptidase/acylaminoacyl peptidase
VLAARGFFVLAPNYRGSTGRGAAFSRANERDLAGRDFDDILAGIDHLVRLGLVDPDRVGIEGQSDGGYLAAWAATRHSRRFKAAVVNAGTSNVISHRGVNYDALHSPEVVVRQNLATASGHAVRRVAQLHMLGVCCLGSSTSFSS